MRGEATKDVHAASALAACDDELRAGLAEQVNRAAALRDELAETRPDEVLAQVDVIAF